MKGGGREEKRGGICEKSSLREKRAAKSESVVSMNQRESKK